jgi:hypothetical protein
MKTVNISTTLQNRIKSFSVLQNTPINQEETVPQRRNKNDCNHAL